MGELRHRLDLALKTSQGFLAAGLLGANQLHGAGAAQESVLSEIDLAHGPLAKEPRQLILTDLLRIEDGPP
jgi:hypothetical protein